MLSKPHVWTALSDYSIGEENSSLSFSNRLARDNDWTQNYAELALEEYKKFVYLIEVSKQSLTPSDQVDQVWHLHLLYTRDYWGAFSDLLTNPIHHGPTPGGEDAQARYRHNYKLTLDLYQREFGCEAPKELWPGVDERFSAALLYKRVLLSDDTRTRSLSSRLFNYSPVLLLIIGGVSFATAYAHEAIEEAGGGFFEWVKHHVLVHPFQLVWYILLGGLIGWALLKLFVLGKKSGKSDSGCSYGCGSGCSSGCAGCS